MGLELLFGKPHLIDAEARIAQHKTFRHERGFFSRLFGFLVPAISFLRTRAFVRRELFIRSTSGTKRIVLERGVQVQLVVLGLGLVLWLAYSTSGVLLGKSSNKIMQERLAETHNAYEEKISTLQKEYEGLDIRVFLAEKEFTKLSDELMKRHEHLTNLMGIQQRIGEKMRKRSKTQKKMKPKNGKESFLKPLRGHDDVLLSSRPAGPTYAQFPSQPLQVNSARATTPTLTNKKNLDKLILTLVAIDREQRAILDHMHETIGQRLEGYKKAFAQTEAVKADLFTTKVAQEGGATLASYGTSASGIGGPLIAIKPPQEKAIAKQKPAPFYKIPRTQDNLYKSSMQARAQVNALQTKIKELADLDRAIAYLPLARPIPSYYITSAFGPRIDPFTREWAFHTGMDVAGSDDRVQATLPGLIVFAGTARGYGKMVEIDHGFGIKTRYGHLKEFAVRKGDKVKFRQQIGLMGNTGRSTGEHLHYEILFNDKPYDPWKFMEAGKNVFEASQ